VVYVHRIASYFIKSLKDIPYFYNEKEGIKKSDDYKIYTFENSNKSNAFLALFNSSTFYFYWHTYHDGYHCGKKNIEDFQSGDLTNLSLSNLGKIISKDLIDNSNRRVTYYKNTGKVEYDEFFPKKSKPIIDQIDTVLAEHYGFTEAELDFIINYDIKYRMGKALFGEEENEEN
jgi:hypothetical protein